MSSTTRGAMSAEAAARKAFDVGGLGLRVATAVDLAFLCTVFCSTRVEEFTRTGWDAQRIEAFLQEQFRLQHEYYQRHYPSGRFDIVELHGETIGRLYYAYCEGASGGELRLIDISLLPAWRGGGIGTRLMHAVLAEAWKEQRSVSLHVEVNNPVRALYARLGFVKTGESGVYELMLCAFNPRNVEKNNQGQTGVTGLSGLKIAQPAAESHS